MGGKIRILWGEFVCHLLHFRWTSKDHGELHFRRIRRLEVPYQGICNIERNSAIGLVQLVEGKTKKAWQITGASKELPR